MKGRTVGVITEEVRRSENTSPLSVTPVRQHTGAIRIVRHDHAEVLRQRIEPGPIGDVPAFFEGGVAKREADTLAGLKVRSMGAVHQCEGVEGGAREPVDIKILEQARGDLLP